MKWKTAKWKLMHFMAGPIFLIVGVGLFSIPRILGLIAFTLLVAIVFEAGQWDIYATFKSWRTAFRALWKDTLCDLGFTVLGIIASYLILVLANVIW